MFTGWKDKKPAFSTDDLDKTIGEKVSINSDATFYVVYKEAKSYSLKICWRESTRASSENRFI